MSSITGDYGKKELSFLNMGDFFVFYWSFIKISDDRLKNINFKRGLLMKITISK